MWGLGGRHYWGRKEKGEVEGIVVVFAWMSSQDKNLKNYVDLYSSLGWNSLVCHPQFLNSFFPDKAMSLALDVLNELIKELKVRPCPVVFASFSGGPKACMYKALQIVDGQCDSRLNLDECRLVRESVSGHIFDSCPVDFTTERGSQFILHPTVLKMSRPPLFASWIVHGMAYGLDTLFLTNLESQRAEFWQTLYASVGIGAPYLIFCSEDDDIAPFQTICNFAQRLESLGGDVKLVKWIASPHVGHYRYHPREYKAAVTELLTKAASFYSKRPYKLEANKMVSERFRNETAGPINDFREAVASSNPSFHKLSLGLNDHFIVPRSVEYQESRDAGPVHDEQKERFILKSDRPSKINAHGILGQILFDVCVPENVEDWDVGLSSSKARFVSSRGNSHFNPLKCMRRSRL